jgi:hypothetical protein
MCINYGEKRDFVAHADITKEIQSIKPHHGDILLLGDMSIPPDLRERPIWDWLSNFTQTNQIAIYRNMEIYSNDFFSAPVYHWIAPIDNPRSFTNSSYFFEGKLLGNAGDGFEKMLSDIEQRGKKPIAGYKIYILGSSYFATSYSFSERPYDRFHYLLDKAMSRADVIVKEFSSLRFGREMK